MSLRTVVIGCGNWGARLARRMNEMDEFHITAVMDADHDVADRCATELGLGHAARDLAGLLNVMRPDAVLIATPPDQREAAIDVCIADGGVRKIRVEKPLAHDAETAIRIAGKCADAGIDLTVGFTLLHHPVYEAAFTYLQAAGRVLEIEGMRVGRRPGHSTNPILDLGIHTASIASHLGVPCRRLVVAYMTSANARHTTFVTPHGRVVVDETTLTVHTPDGPITIDPAHDALGRDLAAWARGTHRGTPETALIAQGMVHALSEVAQCAA